jgi:putative Mg2+ transporter-C (MgtC) family protein
VGAAQEDHPVILAAAAAAPHLARGPMAGRIFLALLLAGIIGIEREVYGHPAGMRTHVMVGLGASLFAVLSTYGFQEFVGPRNDTTYQVDVTRVVSQIVVGIGFLGAGTVLKEGATVRGLTTAASLWVTAAIGTACGIGAFWAAGVTTVAVMVSLVALRVPRQWLRRTFGRRTRTAVFRVKAGADPSGVVQALHALERVDLRSLSIEGRTIQVDVRVPAEVDLGEELAAIGDLDDVEGLDLT